MAGCLNGGSCLLDKEKDAFACSCNPQWSGEKCELIIVCFVDIDECAKNTHKCGANVYCNNTKGGYNCTRLSKKSFVGFHMADLSRLCRSRSAASRPNKARSARQEVDLKQVYNCTCHPGYYGDGKNCEPGEMAGFVSTWKIFEKLCKQTIPLNHSVPK